jgi:hypothetical protein
MAAVYERVMGVELLMGRLQIGDGLLMDRLGTEGELLTHPRLIDYGWKVRTLLGSRFDAKSSYLIALWMALDQVRGRLGQKLLGGNE